MENTKSGIFKIDSDMINLIGCTKENFFKILDLMNYKPQKTNEIKEEFFVYKPTFNKIKSLKNNKKSNKNNPFEKLAEIRFR